MENDRSIQKTYKHFNLTDWEISGFRNVSLIETTDQMANFFAIPFEGDGLIDQHIIDGDVMIVKITTIYEDGKIGVWQTPGGRIARFAYYDFDNSIVLHNDNGLSETFEANELRLLGIVVRSERDL